METDKLEVEVKVVETKVEQKPPRKRGFAAMDPVLVSAIARKGGKEAHRAGTAHEFTSEEAREAGKKGGRATHAKRKAKASNPDPGVTGIDHGGSKNLRNCLDDGEE